MADSIEAGAFLEYELGVQLLPDSEDETFEGIDLLDPTKIVPEELAPVQLVGKLTLDRNPTNYFAETEQVAFHLGNLVPGIQVTNDPLLQARLFSYVDTQLTRLGGPNFNQLPINRPHTSVNDNLRDGMHQTAVHTGLAPYLPNSIDGGGPLTTDGYVEIPRAIAGQAVRENPVSFADHFSQPALFYHSLSAIEQVHIAEAFTFELGKCYEQEIKERELAVLAQIDTALCETVAAGLGLPAPKGEPVTHGAVSPVLSQVVTAPGPITGRIVGVVAGPGADLAGIESLRKPLEAAGAVLRVIAPHGGNLGKGKNMQVVERTFVTARSIEFDAIVVASGVAQTPDAGDIKAQILLLEAFRHSKAIAAWGDGAKVLAGAGIDGPGVLIADKPDAKFATAFIQSLGQLRA
jgi:catalase